MQKVVRLVVRVASRSAPAEDARRENKLHSFPMTTCESGLSGTPVSIGGECASPIPNPNRPAVRLAAAAAGDASRS